MVTVVVMVFVFLCFVFVRFPLFVACVRECNGIEWYGMAWNGIRITLIPSTDVTHARGIAFILAPKRIE